MRLTNVNNEQGSIAFYFLSIHVSAKDNLCFSNPAQSGFTIQTFHYVPEQANSYSIVIEFLSDGMHAKLSIGYSPENIVSHRLGNYSMADEEILIINRHKVEEIAFDELEVFFNLSVSIKAGTIQSNITLITTTYIFHGLANIVSV